MSAIHSDAATPTKGIRRYHTEVKLLVHSHRSTTQLDLSVDVHAIQTGKTIKGIGQANITLVPKSNYFNILAPNDYVNIYFNRNDGKGWVRTFFGLIDRVEEDFTATEEGPQSIYYLLCSDFGKLFDRTEIYMNPHVMNRNDPFTNGSIGSPLPPQFTLMTAGVLMKGTPADVVANVIYATAGFGQQFAVPESYTNSGNVSQFIQQNRQARIATSYGLLDTNEQMRVGGLSGFNNMLNNHVAQVNSAATILAQAGTGIPQTDSFNSLAASINVSPEQLQTSLTEGTGGNLVSNALFNQALDQIAGPNASFGTNASAAFRLGLGAVSTGQMGIVDIINVGSFMEREAIDGYTTGISLITMQGALGNTLKSLSNDIVNELFYDLRPVSNGISPVNVGTDWSTDSDELGGNIDEINGVKYIPAVIMRECPFSTIDKVDASQVSMTLNLNAASLTPASVPGAAQQRQTYGILYFGAIYSNKPNTPGRHIVSIPNINIQDRAGAIPPTNSVGKKHLDVAVISQSEIVKMKLGRSDTDVVDILHISATAHDANDNNFILKDLSPLITPIHIMQHGVRVRQLQTRYARFDQTVSGVSATIASTPSQVAATQQVVSQQAPALVAPAPVLSGEIGSPLQGAGKVGSSYGFRLFDDTTLNWDYHHGIDLRYTPKGAQGGHQDIGKPICAVMDGELVLSAPEGTWGEYGYLIVLRHPGQAPGGGDLYSVYGHLGVPARFKGSNRPVTNATPGGGPRDGRAIGLDQTSTNKRASKAAILGGTYTPANPIVRKGDVIGYMGWTGMNNPNGCHLHFELIHSKNGGIFPASADPLARAQDGTIPIIPLAPRAPGTTPTNKPTNFAYDTIRSLDPVIYYQQKGVNFSRSIITGTIVPYNGTVLVPVPDDEPIETDEETGLNVAAAPDQGITTQAANVVNQATQQATQLAQGVASNVLGGGTSTENPVVRSLIARWLLLQDHWYQHNYEYLSGEIIMRGAPEIRVGYRLDIKERDLSCYVESVNHQWQYGGSMTTTLSVTRGQANNPFPAYVLPRINGLTGGPNQRLADSRLSEYFILQDPLAIKRGRFITQRGGNTGTLVTPNRSATENVTDDPAQLGRNGETFISSSSASPVGGLGSPLNSDTLASLDQIQQMIDATGTTVLPEDPDLILGMLSAPNNQTGNGIPSFGLPGETMLPDAGQQTASVTDGTANLPAPFVEQSPGVRRGGT